MDTRNFDILSEDKRNTILNSAYTCFAKDGYKKTAMSEIAKAANVSKASLFHYFGTKKNLYVYLFNFACKEILAKADSGTEDFFECIEISIRLKMDVVENHPSMFEFFISLVNENDNSILAELDTAHGDAINEWVSKLTANVEWHRFLPEISKEEAFNLISWISDGYAKTYAGKKNRDETTVELRKYLNLIKKVTYKEEYL